MIKKLLPVALFASVTMFLAAFFYTPAVYAQTGSCGGGSVLGLPSWDRYLNCDASNNDAIEGFVFPDDIWLVVLAGVEILTRLAVYIAVGLVIYSGFKFIIAQGNPEKIQEAKTIIEQALTGLGIAVLATIIVVFIGNSIN